jgi:hypothetical protein
MQVERKNKSKYVCKLSQDEKLAVNDMRDWCTQTFGTGGRHRWMRWRFGWTHTDRNFYFKSERDAMFFVLKWQ